MTQKRERLNHIEWKIEHLVEMKRGIEEDLIRLGVAHAHRNHVNRLPNEVLSRVFILVARDHGPVHFPICKRHIPPQLALSHVCSHWRSVAFRTSELWSNTSLYYTGGLIHIHQRWLLRAGTFPVTLSIHFDDCLDGNRIANLLQRILPPLEVKRLYLDLTVQKFMELSTLSENTFSELMELELVLVLRQSEANTLNMHDLHHLIARLRSVTFYISDGSETAIWLDKLSPSLPWSQLRSINVNKIPFPDLRLMVNILRQIPVLQFLGLTITQSHLDSSLEELTLPSLLDFSLNIQAADRSRVELDEILRRFTCPCLATFQLESPSACWTRKTFGILTEQYNMQNLREVEFLGGFALALSFSSILRNAPMLCSLTVRWNAILDDQAIAGISDGTLGRHLQRLEISAAEDLEDVVDMVAARKKKVDEMIKNGCSWKEEITVLKEIYFVYDSDFELWDEKNLAEKLLALKELGIAISHCDIHSRY